jgi:hypothetical protein
MDDKVSEIKQIAAHLLAGMLANPHIYPTLSDEGASGRSEQELRLVAMEMTMKLIAEVEQKVKQK